MKKIIVGRISESDLFLHTPSVETISYPLKKANLEHLFHYADLVTINQAGAKKIVNNKFFCYQDIHEGARKILALGAKSVLFQVDHINDPLFRQDYWTNGQESFWLANQRVSSEVTHDTGQILSSAIADCLASGYSIKDAIVIAKMQLNQLIRKVDIKTMPLTLPENEIDLPYLSPIPLLKFPQPFKPCTIGLYPIVDSSLWIEKLLPQGVKCIQLRIKNKQHAGLEEEIKRSVFLAKKYGANLFINDYWELAIRFAADGVHLGQEDIQQANIDEIHRSGLYLGISTHCYYEMARAHALNPSYIACGPIYSTTSKLMSFAPQGIEQLQRWRRTMHYPIVAIGGIKLERLPELCETGVEGISLISAITHASDPLATTKQFLRKIKELSNE